MLAAVAEIVEQLRRPRRRRRQRRHRPPTVTTARTMSGEEWKRVVDVNLIGAWHTARAALPQIFERARPDRLHRLHLRLRQRHAGQPLRGLQGRGRGARPGAAGRSWHRSARAPASSTSAGSTPSWSGTRSTARTAGAALASSRTSLPDFLLKRITPAEAGADDRARHRGAGAARLRPAVVALRLRPARPDQPAARPPHGARRQDRRGGLARSRRRLASGRLRRGSRCSTSTRRSTPVALDSTARRFSYSARCTWS